MNRKLSYNGKELYQMSVDELKAQLKINQLRLKERAICFLLGALVLAFVHPVLAIIPIAILLLTRYCLLQNNHEIQNEINRR